MPFKVFTRFSIVLLGLSLMACLPAETGTQSGTSADTIAGAQAATRAGTATSNPVVAENFGGGQTSWNDGSTMIYRFTAIERDNEVFVCGAFAGSGSSFGPQFNRQLLRRSSVTVNGDTVLRNLTFFYKAPDEMVDAQVVGSATRCKSTGLAAGSIPLEEVNVELRQGSVRIRV